MAQQNSRAAAIVDIHAHILPGLDDGSYDWEMTLEMAQMAVRSGVAAMVATPHCGLPEQDMEGRAERIRGKVRELRDFMAQQQIPLIVCPGMEIFGTEETPELLRQGKLMTLNGSRYPLIEFPFTDYGLEATRILERVRMDGYIPVVAHPERYQYVQEDPRLLNLWVDIGCLLQLNRGSLMGRFSETAQMLALAMVDRGFACTVASDAHTSVSRTPWMADVEELLRQEFSDEYTQRLLHQRPLALLRDQEIHMPEPDWF